MRRNIWIITTAILALFLGACGDAAAKQKKVENIEQNTAEQKSVIRALAKETPLRKAKDTPTKAIIQFSRAYEEKDLIGVKKRFSSKTLQVITKDAVAKGGNADDAITDFMTKTNLPFEGIPKTRNEEIKGDLATVEVKVKDKWVPMPLVLEDHIWRISFDKGKPGS